MLIIGPPCVRKAILGVTRHDSGAHRKPLPLTLSLTP